MKKFIFFALLGLISHLSATGQRLVIGEKAPDIRLNQWLNNRSPSSEKAVLVDFFHSSNAQCIQALPKLNSLQGTHGSRLSVVVITKEEEEILSEYLQGKGFSFYTGIDPDGKIFTAYGVRFVPFSALIDKRGRLVWSGNLNTLTDDMIRKALE